MPAAAVIPAVASLAGGGMSMMGSKKGQGAATGLAQQQFSLQKDIANSGLTNIAPAAKYYQDLLSGDPSRIAEAVGPTSDILKGQGQASSQQLAATAPMGGEANAAQFANSQNTYNQMARLYAGVQPAAAQALGQLGSSELGVAAPNVGSAAKTFQNTAAAQNQKGGQLGTAAGTGIYNAKNGRGGGGKSAGGTTNAPPGTGNFPGA